MRILVFGAGALGSLIGGLMSKRNEVALVGRAEHVQSINADGLRVSGVTRVTARPTATDVATDGDYDFVFLTVKSYDTRSAMEEVAKLNSTVVSLQNGLGNLETIGEFAERVVGGTTSHGATLKAPGEVIHAGQGDTRIGNFKGVSQESLESLAGELSACGMFTETTTNLIGEVWAKAIVNAGINPLTALLRSRNGYLLENKTIEGMLERVCLEAVLVAISCEIPLPEDDMVERTKTVARMTTSNLSSMLQDVMNRKRTEIDSITGEFIRRGGEKGVPTPANESLLALIKGVEDSFGV